MPYSIIRGRPEREFWKTSYQTAGFAYITASAGIDLFRQQILVLAYQMA